MRIRESPVTRLTAGKWNCGYRTGARGWPKRGSRRSTHSVTTNPIRLDAGTRGFTITNGVGLYIFPLVLLSSLCLALGISRMGEEVRERYKLTFSRALREFRFDLGVCAKKQMMAPKRRLPFITTLQGTDITVVGATPILIPGGRSFR